MHTAQIRQEIIDRVLDRRGHLHLFDRLEPNETALVVIDMQPTFVAPGSLADVLRPRGALICCVSHTNSQTAGGSDWNGFFDYFVADDVRAKTLASLKPGSPNT